MKWSGSMLKFKIEFLAILELFGQDRRDFVFLKIFLKISGWILNSTEKKRIISNFTLKDDKRTPKKFEIFLC